MSAKFAVAVTAIIKRDDTVLLLKRSPEKAHLPGYWDPCSGRMESGETPEQAVVREAFEETGLDVTPVRVLDTFHFYYGPQQEEFVGMTFLCRPLCHRGDGEVVLSAEHTEARWVKLGEVDGYEMADGLKDVLDALA